MENLAWNGIPISASSPLNSGIIVDNEVEDCQRMIVCRKTILSGYHSAVAHDIS